MYSVCLFVSLAGPYSRWLKSGQRIWGGAMVITMGCPDHKADLFQSQQQQIPVAVMNHSG